MLVVGSNGVGKTNLLEAIHVGGQGFSPRTRSDTELIRFGATATRVALRGERAGAAVEIELTLRLGEGKRAKLNGAPLRAAEQLRARLNVLVFTPDRLVVVKGGPAVRRAYFDRTLGRLTPGRAGVPLEYGAALAQRNSALRRVAAGLSARPSVAPWTERVATLGAQLVEARRGVVSALAQPLAELAAELGLPGLRLEYGAEPPTLDALEGRLERDLDRGATSLGPHLDDVAVLAGSRDLRSFGSQGEQRLAVLSLILAEAELLRQRHSSPPLLLLDDVLSELDTDRRRRLAERISNQGQAMVTATSRSVLPLAPAQVVEIEALRTRGG